MLEDGLKNRAERLEVEKSRLDNKPLRLQEYHYETCTKITDERIRLGMMDRLPKPVSAIPGYSGFIPRKESANVIGRIYK